MSGIYIHIPFCAAKCLYCDFYSMPRKERHDLIDKYPDALMREYSARCGEIAHEPVTTVYIGGGTPTSLPIDMLEGLIKVFNHDSVKELTIEVNPEDVTEDVARRLISAGVTRISMGVQSLNDTELRTVGRRHNSQQAIEAFHTLRHAGASNISLDIIYGLPHQTIESWTHTLDTILELGAEHLSAYALAYEPGTRLHAMLNAGKISEASQELYEKMYNILCERTRQHGMEHYEIANFALPGLHSRHNSSYWNFTPYLGLGAGAHSFDGTVRRYNPTNVAQYISNPTNFTLTEQESHRERYNDYIMTSLRTSAGIDIDLTSRLFGVDMADMTLTKAEALTLHGSLKVTAAGHYAIPKEKWLLADAITLNFIEV
ncbi:MAG: radical SAM family heme chaperone HemW [Muribaculaceae bacterium]|nr:radical SAM family heme chaperone HemW [Muribaculaceae bacterium]